jgi:hypothetical protein
VQGAKTWDAGRPVDFGPIRLTLRELWGETIKYSKLAARDRLTRLVGRSRD